MKSSFASIEVPILLFFGLSSLSSSINPSSYCIQHQQPSAFSINPNKRLSSITTFIPRGGAQQQQKKTDDAYNQLASALLPRLLLLSETSSSSSSPKPIQEKDIVKALKSLASAQSTLKRIDGAAHEAYQRTHKEEEEMEKAVSAEASSSAASSIEGVTGRAARSASRAGCAADALLAAELCELLDDPSLLVFKNDKTRNDDEEEEERGGEEEDDEGTLSGREIVHNITITHPYYSSSSHEIDPPTINILVLYEPNYNGEAGIHHGGIDEILRSSPSSSSTAPSSSRGRYLVILRDSYSTHLSNTLTCLDEDPQMLELNAGLVANEIASVNGMLWELAGLVLVSVGEVLRRNENEMIEKEKNNENDEEEGEEKKAGGEGMKNRNEKAPPPAIHFVGRSLAGGVAALAASILDGTLPMPDDEILGITSDDVVAAADDDQSSKRKRRRSKRSRSSSSSSRRRRSSHSRRSEEEESDDRPNDESSKNEESKGKDIKNKVKFLPSSLSGYGRGRSSAVALGPPPCLSSNVKATFITSVIHGDDVICRTTKDSLDKLCKRTQRAMKGGVLGRRVGWMGDALSLTVSSLKSHAHGSEGEEARLSVPGKAYLVRPRRLGGASSMHEVGASGSGSGGSGREALRAAVLWQLNDVLLSRSMWVHHELKSYINGLDRVLLRGFVEDEQKHHEDRWD